MDFDLFVPEVKPREVFNILFFKNQFKITCSDKTYPTFLHYFMEEF